MQRLFSIKIIAVLLSISFQVHAQECKPIDWFEMAGKFSSIGSVSQIEKSPEGTIYVLGDFTHFDGKQANYLVKSDGDKWVSFWSPEIKIPRRIHVINDNNIYVFGPLYIGHWDGNSWEEFSYIDPGKVKDCELDSEGNLIVVGNFTTTYTITSNYIVRWNGLYWDPIENDLNGPINSISKDNNGDFILGGDFTSVAGLDANRIVKWDGENWHKLGNGFNNTVTDVAIDPNNNRIYACGAFDKSGDSIRFNLAYWNGTDWSDMGTNQFCGSLRSLQIENDGTLHLFGGICVEFEGGSKFLSYAMWKNNEWEIFDYEMNLPTDCIHIDDKIYFTGSFIFPGYRDDVGIIQWDGNIFSPIARIQNDGVINSIHVTGDNRLFVAGRFSKVNDKDISNVAHWDGENWINIDISYKSGYGYEIFDIDSDSSGNVYFAGHGIYKLEDGHVKRLFPPISVGIIKSVLCDKNSDNVYIAGGFRSNSKPTFKYIGMWDGNNWIGLDQGFNHSINCLDLLSSGELIAGGNFTYIGSNRAKYIASFDGTTWTELGGGRASIINSLAVDSFDNIYVGGYSLFNKWNGSNWVNPSIPSFNTINVIVLDLNNKLFVAGYFYNTQGYVDSKVLKYDGNNWDQIGSPSHLAINSITSGNKKLFIGGEINVLSYYESNYVNSIYLEEIEIDTLKPQMEQIDEISLSVDGNCSALIPNLEEFFIIKDNCDSFPTFSQSLPVGSELIGCGTETSITVYATDFSGNIDSLNAAIFLKDSIICPSIQDSIIYVSQIKPTRNTGLGWYNATNDLIKALELSKACTNVKEIWITNDTFNVSVEGKQYEQLVLGNNVKIYGGFHGLETAKTEIPSNSYSIISGKLDNLENGALSLRLMINPPGNSTEINNVLFCCSDTSFGYGHEGAAILNYGQLKLDNTIFENNSGWSIISNEKSSSILMIENSIINYPSIKGINNENGSLLIFNGNNLIIKE